MNHYTNIVGNLPKESGIYCIIFPNNKKYIGQSRNIRHRVLTHLKESFKEKPGFLVCSAIKKYGIENIQVVVVEICPIDNLNELECKYIKEYNSFIDNGCGYNLTTGGGVGHKLSESTRLKRSVAAKLNWELKTPAQKEEIIEKIRVANLDKVITEKQKLQISETLKTFYEDRKQNTEAYSTYIKNLSNGVQNYYKTKYSEEDRLKRHNLLSGDNNPSSLKSIANRHGISIDEARKYTPTYGKKIFSIERKLEQFHRSMYFTNTKYIYIISSGEYSIKTFFLGKFCEINNLKTQVMGKKAKGTYFSKHKYHEEWTIIRSLVEKEKDISLEQIKTFLFNDPLYNKVFEDYESKLKSSYKD